MGRDKIHQAKAQRLHARVRGNVKGPVHRQGRFDQHVQGQISATGGIQHSRGTRHVVHGLHLGHHQVRQMRPGRAHDVCNIGVESRMVHRVNPHAHTLAHWRVELYPARQFGHQGSVFGLAAHGRAVLAVQRHVEDACTEPLDVTSL